MLFKVIRCYMLRAASVLDFLPLASIIDSDTLRLMFRNKFKVHLFQGKLKREMIYGVFYLLLLACFDPVPRSAH